MCVYYTPCPSVAVVHSQALGSRAPLWANPAGAIVHAWHSQSWAMHMFEVSAFDRDSNSLEFSRGGWQARCHSAPTQYPPYRTAPLGEAATTLRMHPRCQLPLLILFICCARACARVFICLQGGRSWCRCDQCTYAGKFCTQHQVPPPKEPDTRLIGGDLFIENIREELDAPGEFFFNRTEHKLYFMYVRTLHRYFS